MSKKPPEIPYIPNPAMRQIAVPIASLVLDPDNERKHDRANIDAIKGLIRKFGIMEPIGVREGLVIRGNGTTIALRELAAEKATALEPLSKMLADPTAPLDWSLVPALDYQHLDESAAAAWRVGHNRSAELGKWDWEKLQTTLRNTAVEWTEIGWEQTELEAILVQAADGSAEHVDKEVKSVDPDQIDPYDPDTDFFIIKIENVPPGWKEEAVARVNETLRGVGDGTLVAKAY